MVFLKGALGAGNRAFENGAGHGFNIGAAMLYNIPAPLLKPRRVRAQSSKSQLVRRTLTTQHRGGNGFFVILVPHFKFKFRPRFWTYECKNRAPFLKPIAYIYIYIYAGELLVCPPFGLSRVISLATTKVISLSGGGPFSHNKNWGFWGLLCWNLVQFGGFLFPFFTHLSPFFWWSFSNFPKPLFLKRPFLNKHVKSVFQKTL